MFWIARHEAGLKLGFFYSLERRNKLKVKASVRAECVNLTRVMCYHQHLTAGLMRAGRHVIRWGGVGSAHNQHECVCVCLCSCVSAHMNAHVLLNVCVQGKAVTWFLTIITVQSSGSW